MDAVAELISIHALREESDIPRPGVGHGEYYFNPRPPRGERHIRQNVGAQLRQISIHALREESD